MLQAEHSALLSTYIKLRHVIKIFVLSIWEWSLKTGFIVFCTEASKNKRGQVTFRKTTPTCRLLITFAHSLDADQARHSDGIPTRTLSTKMILKKKSADDKNNAKLPSMQKVKQNNPSHVFFPVSFKETKSALMNIFRMFLFSF